MERLVLLGATGSIGRSALDVIRSFPERFELIGVSGWGNIPRLAEIIDEFRPQIVCLREENPGFEANYPDADFLYGGGGLQDLAALDDADAAIMAISGTAGLQPTLAAIGSGKRLLTANKESIVCAGDIIMREAAAFGTEIIPLDSEHNAVFNLLTRFDPATVGEITLTASGGPFRDKPIGDQVTLEQVLDHPTWDMGQYITVNSATLMNKGFEVIEAHHLFGMDYGRIRVVIHPQSLVHGMVRGTDGTLYMSASPSDMRIPISLAMFFPETPPETIPRLGLPGVSLEFREPDLGKFPLLKLAYDMGREGGVMPAALNAANETVVNAFLEGKTGFDKIPGIVMRALDGVTNIAEPDLDTIMDTDWRVREKCGELLKSE